MKSLVGQGFRLGEADTANGAPVARTDASIAYASGDRLLLYSDGITEWPSPTGKDYGAKRLQKALAAARG